MSFCHMASLLQKKKKRGNTSGFYQTFYGVDSVHLFTGHLFFMLCKQPILLLCPLIQCIVCFPLMTYRILLNMMKFYPHVFHVFFFYIFGVINYDLAKHINFFPISLVVFYDLPLPKIIKQYPLLSVCICFIALKVITSIISFGQ